MEKTNKAITVTELLPLLSEAARDEVLELAEKQLRAFYIAGYIDGAADTDALPK